MSANLRSAATAGVIAFVIYTVSAMFSHDTLGHAVPFGLACGLATFGVAYLVIVLIDRSRNRQHDQRR